MPFIQSAVTTAQEPEPAPEGRYDLRIHSIKERKSTDENGKTKHSIECMILIEDSNVLNAPPLNFYLPLLTGEEDHKSSNFKLLQQHRFLTLFGIPFDDDGFNTDDFPGAFAGAVEVKQVEVKPKDPSKAPYMRNEMVLPRVLAEPAQQAAQQPRRARR